MNKSEKALFDFRSQGGKACKKKYGSKYYVELAKKSHIKRRLNKKLSTGNQ